MKRDDQLAKPQQERQFASGSVRQPTVQSSAVPKQDNTESAEQHAKDGAEPTKPLFVQIVGGDDLEPFEEQSLAVSRETLAISRSTYWIAVLAFFAAAAIFVYSQFKVMSYQTQIMARQTESDAAGGSLNAVQTQKQFDLNRQTLRVDQRAWVAVWFDHAIMEPTLPFTVGLKLQNLGKTPARHCQLHATVDTAKKHFRRAI